jgi:hypothetical protein
MNRAQTFTVTLLLATVVAACDSSKLIPLRDGTPVVIAPKTVTLVINSVCPPEGQTYKAFIARQRSYSLKDGVPRLDTDWDGVPDVQDNSADLNLMPDQADTNGDGVEDLMVFAAGLSASAQRALPECTLIGVDTDLDGISDCSEILLGTDPRNPDQDGDGIPDGMELALGLDYSNTSDAWLDSDSDGVSNLDEVKLNTPPFEANGAQTAPFTFQYKVESVKVEARDCRKLTVSNVPVVPVNNGNQIDFYFFLEQGDQNRRMCAAKIIIPSQQPGDSTITYAYNELISENRCISY